MGTLDYSFSDYYQRVGEFLGLTAVGTAPTGNNLTKCKEIVYRGYKRFLYPTDKRIAKRHVWSFLKKYATLTTEDGKWKYALPEDFLRVLTDPTYSTDDAYDHLIRLSGDYILQKRVDSSSSGYPWNYAIVASDFDVEVGTTWEIWLYETPDSAYTLHYWYEISVPEPSDASEFLIGGVDTDEALLECCLAVAEQQEEDGTSTLHTQLADDLLQQLIIADTKTKSNTLGRMLGAGPRSVWDKERNLLTNFQDDNLYPDT